MSLRIKLSVRRCDPSASGDRIRYQHGDARLIPEELVLRRWKDRSNEASAKTSGVRFDGCRLPPGTWTLLRKWLEQGLRQEDLVDPVALKQYAEKNRAEGVKLHAPEASKFAASSPSLKRKACFATSSSARDPLRTRVFRICSCIASTEKVACTEAGLSK